MKRSIVFILLLVSSFFFKANACYFYPYGEDIRFSVFNPDNFRYNGYRIYNYTSTYFYKEDFVIDPNSVTENDRMWFEHCHKAIPISEIKKAIFEIDISDVTLKSKNKFIQYLFKKKDFEAIHYLIFAKELEKLNPDSDELWENKKDNNKSLRERKIQEAYQKISSISNVIIKKRYYYQICKLLSYNNDKAKIIALYESYQKQYKTTDFIDNWIFNYRMIAESDDVKTNYLASQVFARGTDNKFDIKWSFNKNIPIEKVLKFAKNDIEKANIYVLYSFRKIDQNLDVIKKIQQYDTNSSGLSFLLLREINKLEDWILTPTYTMYLPTLREDYWENSNEKRILNRVEVDRIYASKVLDFVNSVDLNKVDDKQFWLLSKAYLEFLTKDYKNALVTINSVENKLTDAKIKRQCGLIKAMVLTANQEKNQAKIPKEIETLLYNERDNYFFLFGIAKELEILNDKVDAAFLISKIKSDEYENHTPYWKSISGKKTLFDDFYYDWYGYSDAELSTSDMFQLISLVNSKTLSSFEKWKMADLISEKNKLNDLMGIKFMRDDNLKMAYEYFKKVDKNHYTNAALFNENPFYRIKGFMNFDQSKTAKNLNKAKVVQQLMDLIKKADNPKNKTRHQDYLLIANCYYNMSYYGNSWMLKRISRTGNRDHNYDDEMEYYRCNKAKEYYVKAFENSNSTNFKALSSYMIGKCKARENEYLLYEEYDNDYYVTYEQLEKVNKASFAVFKKKYPDQYLEMMSNCEIFSYYFNSKR